LNTWKNILIDLELKDMINYSYILAPVTQQLNTYHQSENGVDKILWKGGWCKEREPCLKIRSHGGMKEELLQMYAISPSHSSLIEPNLQNIVEIDETTKLLPTE